MNASTPLRLILASASPRRFTLLGQIGITPDFVVAASIDETPGPRERPRVYVERMAREKALAAREIAKKDPAMADALLLAADTVVAMGARILPKCTLAAEAARLAPNGKHRSFPRLGHLAHEEDPAAFAALIREIAAAQ